VPRPRGTPAAAAPAARTRHHPDPRVSRIDAAYPYLTALLVVHVALHSAAASSKWVIVVAFDG